MARYIKSFETSGAVYTALNSGELKTPYVAYIKDADVIDYSGQEPDYNSMPLTLEITSGGTIVWDATNAEQAGKVINYQLNGGEWTPITSTTEGVSIDVSKGDIIRFMGSNGSYGKTTNGSGFHSSTAHFDAYGNIMSLIKGSGYTTATTLTSSNLNAFAVLFKYSKVEDASNLILPATGLSINCYYHMFYECAFLTKAPTLKAQTLTGNCYSMMFYNCSSLKYIKCLALNNINSTNCYNWVGGVSAEGTFVKDANAVWSTGNDGIPSGWNVEDDEYTSEL